jgi:threonine dehydrogenase-like Zn-dependent dehydrogenase
MSITHQRFSIEGLREHEESHRPKSSVNVGEVERWASAIGGTLLWSCCDNSNPNAWMAEAAYGHSASGLFGYSHMFGGYAGGQAEYARVPFADVGPFKVPDELSDEQVLFLTDIFPTGYMAAENCEIKPGDTVAVWGCGPVGQFAIRSAFLLGAERVLAIDEVPSRLAMARQAAAETIDMSAEDVYETIQAAYDRAKAFVGLTTDRITAVRQAVQACRKGGVISLPGVYGGLPDKFPLGAAFSKGLTFKMGQTHVHRYLKKLLGHIQDKDIDPSFVITHRLKLEDAPIGYSTFHDDRDECIKVVLKP